MVETVVGYFYQTSIIHNGLEKTKNWARMTNLGVRDLQNLLNFNPVV